MNAKLIKLNVLNDLVIPPIGCIKAIRNGNGMSMKQLDKKMADVHPIVSVLGVIMGLQYLGITGLIFDPINYRS